MRLSAGDHSKQRWTGVAGRRLHMSLLSDKVCAAAYVVLAVPVSIWSSALLFGTYICFDHTAHAALIAYRLGGHDDAAVGVCIPVLGDLQWGLKHS